MGHLEKGDPPPSTISDPPDNPPEGELAGEADLTMLTSDPSERTEGISCEVGLLAPTSRGRPCDLERSATTELEESVEP